MNIAYLQLLAAILAEVVATTCLKSSEGFTRHGFTAVTVVGYVASFYFLGQALKVVPVGIAYALWGGVGIVAMSALGYVLFAQKLDLPAVIDIGLILAGVLVLNLFSKTMAH